MVRIKLKPDNNPSPATQKEAANSMVSSDIDESIVNSVDGMMGTGKSDNMKAIEYCNKETRKLRKATLKRKETEQIVFAAT